MVDNKDYKSEQKYDVNIQKVGQNGTRWKKCRSKSFSENFATMEEEDVI